MRINDPHGGDCTIVLAHGAGAAMDTNRQMTGSLSACNAIAH